MQLSLRPTLLGRSLILAISELAANAICWIVAGILFGRNQDTRPILSLSLLAWTLGLRHALDADHISAIDNATRGLISLGQLPVTCGLFFSLGHSTIVIVVTVAIAISSDVFERMNKVGEVGGIVGAAVSGSFLFIVGLANTIILWRILKQRRRETLRNKRIARGEILPDLEYKPHHNHMLMMRILGPLMTFVNRPWKMYPVGLLFGFGFDTASSIALLAISAVAKRGSDGRVIPSSNIIILPLLFTAGMTLVDSADSILMLYSYIGFPKRGWVFIEKKSTIQEDEDISPKIQDKAADSEALAEVPRIHSAKVEETEVPMSMTSIAPVCTYSVPRSGDGKISRDREVKMNVMSGLSIILTIMSILVAFSISLITIMGLIGEQCNRCSRAAEAEDGGGLEGSWWRAWARANDNS
ncbi:Hydrogenase nickel incorporation protein hupN, partial [Termitomyces sp. T112]